MRMDGDMMRMREVEEGLEIAPGGRAELQPGGYHLMFLQVKRPLLAGEVVDVELAFDRGGKLEVEFTVIGLGESPPGQ